MKNYYTIKDIENIASEVEGSTFKGRANEFIKQLSEDFGITFNKGLNERKVEEYQFSEEEKDLLVLLLKNKRRHPMAHKNTKKNNVTLEQVRQYQQYLLEDIAKLPDPLGEELAADIRVKQVVDILMTFDSINKLNESLEFLFYMLPTEKAISLLKKREKQMKELENEAFLMLKDSIIEEKQQEHSQKGKDNPTEKQLQRYLQKRVKEKIEKIQKGIDPEVHLLDHLICQKLKELTERNRKK
ncbi:hypothetical protein ABEO87_10955 [Geobacillus stearothermophilus]|uniref:hypothetical protein n=1 Tax=Geobacillus stearothermophilus TaxID=1422 RepID=UPI003D1A4DA1